MKVTIATIIMSFFMVTSASAEGCLKGAAAGAFIGHFMKHKILGAAAGCAIGSHMAAKNNNENVDITKNPQQTNKPQFDQPANNNQGKDNVQNPFK